jgi:hypothetical protein
MTTARAAFRLMLPSCLLVFVCAAALLLPSCGWDGHFTVLGYTTRPNYDCSIKTVRVPIFKNQTMRRGIEFDLTKAVVREIEQKTPFKVVGHDSDADTELTGNIISLNKNILNRNQLNEVREAEMVLIVEVIWRDLRPDHLGEILSGPKRGPINPDLPPDAPPPPIPPQILSATGGFIPELGGSITTAQKQAVDRLAVQIVSMMEVPW